MYCLLRSYKIFFIESEIEWIEELDLFYNWVFEKEKDCWFVVYYFFMCFFDVVWINVINIV